MLLIGFTGLKPVTSHSATAESATYLTQKKKKKKKKKNQEKQKQKKNKNKNQNKMPYAA